MRQFQTCSATTVFTVLSKSVLFVKRMAMDTMRFSRIYCGWAYASKYVFFFSNQFQMTRVNAFSISAKVIYLMRGWNFMIKVFKRMTMCTQRFVDESEIAVATTIKTPCPLPTNVSKIYEFKERVGMISLSHIFSITYIFTLSSK